MVRRHHAAAPAPVVSLAEVRERSRVSLYRRRLERVLGANRRAIGRLYSTGALFTREGTKAGRDLLKAHQHLLRVNTLLDRLEHQGDVPAPLTPEGLAVIYAELDTLFASTDELGAKTAELLARLKRD